MLILSEDEKIFDNEMQQESYEIVGKIDKLRIGHESFLAARSGIARCVMESVYAREPVNCMVLGEGGAGKTSLAKLIEKSYPPTVIREDDVEVKTVPVFYTSFKSTKSLDALTTDILRKLGDPNPETGRLGDKANRVLTLLINCRTKIFFIDELHDLRENKEDLLKWVKEITNECGPIVCLMGLEKCKSIFAGDSEMSRRFKNKFILRQLTVGTLDKTGQLLPFLTEMCKAIMNISPIRSFPPLGNYEHALQIWAATKGNPDFVMTLLKEAVLRALLAGRNAVTVEDLAVVWESGILSSSSLVKFNPFKATQVQIVASIRKLQA